MILSKRVQRPPPDMSYPSATNSELAPWFSSPELLVSPPATPPRGHKYSPSKPMAWLNRTSSSSTSSSHPIPHVAPKPTRISEPKVYRSGPLGSGVTIVRTPREAFSSSGPPHACELIVGEEQGAKADILLHNTENSENRLPPSLPSSPPLPPLPDIPDTEGEDGQSISLTNVPLSDSHPCSSGSPPLTAHRSSSRPTLLAHSRAPSRSIPALPVDTDPMPPQPPFEAVLLSFNSDGVIDPSKLIITLETCTTMYRTSLRSLVSRPSHLSRYIMSLLSPSSETASIHSNGSDASLAQHNNWFDSVFRDHLTSSGCLPQSSTGIHVFLDRPSAPYTHVLAYLRSLSSTPDRPEALPRAVQLGPMSPSRLESLLELRDEASYLGLVELYKLCCQEMNRFHRPPLSTTVGMLCGKTGSVRSFHTEPHQEVRSSEFQVSKGNGSAHGTARSAARESSSSSCENKDALVRQGRGVGSPPPGWI